MNKNIFLLILMMLISTNLMAATTGNTLPWEAGLGKLVTSFTGPVAYAVSVIGIVISIGVLIFGGDLSGFGRTIIFIILAASVIVTAANTLQLFTGAGATLMLGSASVLVLALTLIHLLASVMTWLQTRLIMLLARVRQSH